MADKSYDRIFIFSQEQMDLKKRVEGNRCKFGTVVVNGSKKIYTDIVKNMSRVQYGDAKVIIQGDIRKIKYFPPAGEELEV